VLFLVHHAEAVDAGVDPQRPLTAVGCQHAEQLAANAHERGAKPAVIWHSGKLRARQTAEYFWRACNPLAEFSAVRGVQPGDPPEWIKDHIAQDDREIMLVGHMPHMARLLELLVRTSDTSEVEVFPLHGIVALSRMEGGWRQEWVLGF
jgi:phosphohistidine phosphatase